MILPKRVLYPYILAREDTYRDLGIIIYRGEDFLKMIIPGKIINAPCSEATNQEELFCWIRTELDAIRDEDLISVYVFMPDKVGIVDLLAPDINCEIETIVT